MAKQVQRSNPDVESVEDGLIEGLTDLRDTLRSGVKLEERYTVRTVELEFEPQQYTPQDIKRLRDAFHVSQSIFAELIGVKVKTLQSWEQGIQDPPKIARRLLDLMTKSPEQWVNVLRESRRDTETVGS